MKIHLPSARSSERGMNLFELMVFVANVAIAANFSVYMASSHHWLLGIIVFPLGFCSAACAICLLGEVAVRRGYSRMGRTPSVLIWRSLVVGTIFGIAMGIVFYCLGIFGIIPITVGNAHRLLLSACFFGLSVALTVAFIQMLRRGTR